MPNYRASVGHPPFIHVKRANPVTLSGQNVGLTIGTGGTTFFQDGFESGNFSAWTSGVGTPTVVNTDSTPDGTWYMRAPMVTGSGNDHGRYKEIGTAGNLSTQFRSGFLQFKFSMDSFTGNWPATNHQKIAIVQYYDVAQASYSNAFRKFQVLITTEGNDTRAGEYYITLIEWNNESGGSFRDGREMFQNTTAVGPAASFNKWDTLRLEIQLDTNGSQSLGQMGPGFGNGIIRLWCNNVLILEYTNVNIVRGNPNVGCGRVLLSSLSDSWQGTNTAQYWDRIQLASSSSLLDAMPSVAATRVSSYVPNIFKSLPFRTGTGPAYDTGMSTRFDPGTSSQLITGGGHDGLNCVRVTYAQGQSQLTGGWFGNIGTPSGGYAAGGILTGRFRMRMPSNFRWNGDGSQQNKQFILFYGSGTQRFMLMNEGPHDTSPGCLGPAYESATNRGHFGGPIMKHNIGTPTTQAVPLTYQGGPSVTPNPTVSYVVPGTLGWYHLQFQIKTADSGSNGTFKIWVNNNTFASPNSSVTGCSITVPFFEMQFGWFWTDANSNVACSFDYRDLQFEWASSAQGEQVRFNPNWYPG